MKNTLYQVEKLREMVNRPTATYIHHATNFGLHKLCLLRVRLSRTQSISGRVMLKGEVCSSLEPVTFGRLHLLHVFVIITGF